MQRDQVLGYLRALEHADAATAAHTWRVVLYTRALAEHAGEPPQTVDRLAYAAALHDVGKLDVPAQILRKPGPLTPDERAVMQTHAPRGHQRLLDAGETDPLVLSLVRHHHERLDGSGYPDALVGAQIPPAARAFAVIDTFDAMTSLRPYRAEVSEHAAQLALDELTRHAGTWYCPEHVDAFATLYRSGALVWIHEYYNDACPLPPFLPGHEQRGRASTLQIPTTPTTTPTPTPTPTPTTTTTPTPRPASPAPPPLDPLTPPRAE